MKKEQRLDLYQKALDTWGERAQLDQMIEEMAELTVAINKYKRIKYYNESKDEQKMLENLYMELADVSMCLEQMLMMFPLKKIEAVKQKQLERLAKALKISF